MTKIYLSLFLIALTSAGIQAQQTWDNFEDIRKGTYDFISGTFIPYNENPDMSGANTSRTAAKYTRNSAETFDVIVLDARMADLTDYLSDTKQMSIDVWSPEAGKTVQITLESTETAAPDNFPTGRHSVYLTQTTVAGAWETLTFSFDTQPDATVANDNVDRIVLLFDPNSNNADEYYWDNLNGPELEDDPCEGVEPTPGVLNDFECNQNVKYTFSHSGINFRREINPDMNINESAYVARYARNGGEENDVIIGKFDGALELQPESKIELDVWDPNAPTEVIVSLQTDNGDLILEMTASTSVSSEWQTLEYDPIEASGSTDINQFVILFDPGNFSGLTYYYDNFEVTGTVGVSEIDEFAEFTVFPNPSTDIANFQYNLESSADVNLVIQDITGKVVYQAQYNSQSAGQHQIELDVTQFNSGLYIFNINTENLRSTGKLVVSK